MQTLGDLGIHDEHLKDLPASVMDGDEDSVGNLDAAGEAAAFVYTHWNDDSWRNAFIMGLAQHIENQMIHHRAELQGLHDSAKRAIQRTSRRVIMKSYISDVMADVVNKAVFDPNKHPRGSGGRFSDEGGYDRAQSASLAAAMTMASTKPVTEGQTATFTIRDKKSGKIRQESHKGKAPKLDKNERIVSIQNHGVSNPEFSRANDAVNFATMLGADQAVAGSAGVVANEMNRQGKYRNNDGSADWFGRLGSASETLHHATNNDRVKTAAAMGKMVGKYGPETSKVVGPHARRLSYKYRGEAAPAAQWVEAARAGRQKNSKGELEPREALEHKLALNLAKDRRSGGLEAIPTEVQAEALLKTGSTAPSHGFILNHKGDVKQQAKGKADDHYTPFNIKDMHHLNKGSYVRSRAYGGPTTDDFATALKTGATSFTTISRTGVYKVEFTPQTDKAGKKTGAWAKDTAGDGNHAMVTRYGKLLDVVKHGQVEDPENGGNTSLNGRGYEVALQSLQKQYPYQIKSVSYTPLKAIGDDGVGQRASQHKTDSGYVRPFYLKPGDAQYGYVDDKLGPRGSFDELDAYRLGKARFFAAQSAARSNYVSPTTGTSAPRGVPGQAPTTLNQGQKDRYNAVAGDYGRVVSSTPATEQLDPSSTWSKVQTDAYLDTVKDLLDHIGPQAVEHGGHDIEQLHEQLGWKGTRDHASYEEFRDRVRTDPSERDNIADILDDLPNHTYLNSHGLNIYQQANRVSSANDASLADPVGDRARTPDETASVSAVKQSPEYRRYDEIFGPTSTYQQWKKNPAGLGDKKRAQFDALSREEEHWETPQANLFGLTPKQDMQNRILVAGGSKPIHFPSDDAPIGEPSGPQETDEYVSPEEERERQNDYLRQFDHDQWS